MSLAQLNNSRRRVIDADNEIIVDYFYEHQAQDYLAEYESKGYLANIDCDGDIILWNS